MPIGKNAIKRVENNGYSKVKTSAPDMENSSVIAKPDEQVVEKMVAPVAVSTVKKTSIQKATATATKKSATAKKATATKKPAQAKCAKKDGFIRMSLGDDLPYYLL